MHRYDVHFIGVDFNYKILLTLKRYFEIKKYRKFTLIHADISRLPISDSSVDYIYGGGVIEHFSNTNNILSECHRVTKSGGSVFNTVPAFNLWWLLRFYNNIPALPILKQIFEFIHLKLLNGKILKMYYGYELSFLPFHIRNIHESLGFKHIKVAPFAFHPSQKVMKNKLLRGLYYLISNNTFTCPVYYVEAKK